jgi:hypothetical protein
MFISTRKGTYGAEGEGGGGGEEQTILTRFPSWTSLQAVLVFLPLNNYYSDNYTTDLLRELHKLITSMKYTIAKYQ